MRICNQGQNVSEWADRTGEGSSTYDICKACHVRLTYGVLLDHEKALLVPYQRDEPAGDEGWGGDVEHPAYAEQSPPYRCRICRRKLGEDDD